MGGFGGGLGLRVDFSLNPTRAGGASGPTYIAFEKDPGSLNGTLTNNGDGSWTSTRNSGGTGAGNLLIRSLAPITGNYVLELEMLTLAPTTPGYLGVDDATPAIGTFYNNNATTMAVLPSTDGYIYPKNPGGTDLGGVAAGWGAAVGSKVYIERLGTTVNFRSGTIYATSVVKATTTDTTAARYAGFDHMDNASSFKFRFYAI